MTYNDAVNYIENVPRFVRETSLDNTKKLLHLLGDPDRSFRIIHVAGTNGKGSVCSDLESMLREGGFRTGLFTSPHLVRMNERFMVNREIIGDDAFLSAFLRVKEAWESQEGIHPTYFEILFLMAMVLFEKAGIDVLVMETGLGGRLDATNAVGTAAACVITSISLDHCAVLGENVRAIAAEKAGIMKPGVPCFYIDTDPSVSEVFEKHAQEVPGCDACAVSPSYDEGKFEISSKGIYQQENAALALYTMRHLPEFGIPDETLLAGLKKAVWPGRMEEIAPGIFLDGAHNDDGIRRFSESAAELAKGRECILLFSAVADKEYRKMAATLAKELSPVFVIATQVSSERGVSHEELAGVFRDQGISEVFSYGTVREALTHAVRERDGRILFCVGSLYLVGEIKGCMEEVLADA